MSQFLNDLKAAISKIDPKIKFVDDSKEYELLLSVFDERRWQRTSVCMPIWVPISEFAEEIMRNVKTFSMIKDLRVHDAGGEDCWVAYSTFFLEWDAREMEKFNECIIPDSVLDTADLETLRALVKTKRVALQDHVDAIKKRIEWHQKAIEGCFYHT